jgi:hypothetical protein
MKTMHDIKEAAAASKGSRFWFSQDTMAFFKCKVYDDTVTATVDGGALFVSSEKGPDKVRKYTVRYCTPEGEIGEVSTFQEYKSKAGAEGRLKRAIASGYRADNNDD